MSRESDSMIRTPEENEVAKHFDAGWVAHRVNHNLSKPFDNETSLTGLDLKKDIIWIGWRWCLIPKFQPRFTDDVLQNEQVIQDVGFREFFERTTLLPNKLPPFGILWKCWCLQYPKTPQIAAVLFAFVLILIVVVLGIVFRFPETKKVDDNIETSPTPTPDLDRIPNMSNLMSAVILDQKISTPGLQDCYLTSNQTMEMKSIIRHNVHCPGQKGVNHILEVNMNKVSQGTLQQAVDEYQNSTIGLHLHAGFHCIQNIGVFVKQLTESKCPDLRIIILSAKDTSCSAETMKQLERDLKAPNLQGIWQVQNEDIFVKVVKQDTANPQFVEQLTRQTVAVELIRQSNQNVHLDVEPELAPEVATAVAASLTASPSCLYSVQYKLTERNNTGELQVAIVPAEVVNVLWELGHVPETSKLSRKIIFGKFPECVKELTLEIVHGTVNINFTNLEEIRELCARFSSASFRNFTRYVINCKTD